jgi:nucleoside permease NupC
MLILQSLMGFLALYAFAWAISEKRHAVQWRTVVGAIILQIIMFVLLFKFPYFKEVAAVHAGGHKICVWLHRRRGSAI